jgi:hypothetical protein
MGPLATVAPKAQRQTEIGTATTSLPRPGTTPGPGGRATGVTTVAAPPKRGPRSTTGTGPTPVPNRPPVPTVGTVTPATADTQVFNDLVTKFMDRLEGLEKAQEGQSTLTKQLIKANRDAKSSPDGPTTEEDILDNKEGTVQLPDTGASRGLPARRQKALSVANRGMFCLPDLAALRHFVCEACTVRAVVNRELTVNARPIWYCSC